ncbi:hypothetical protein Rs2_10411 [Raphanus sativus]|nr:hypothetical protein Rs2_10411 [Raphanus sativus]
MSEDGDRISQFRTTFEKYYVLNDYNECNRILDKIQALVQQRRYESHVNIQGGDELNAGAKLSDSNLAANIQGVEDDFQQTMKCLVSFINFYERRSYDECDNVLNRLRGLVANVLGVTHLYMERS